MKQLLLVTLLISAGPLLAGSTFPQQITAQDRHFEKLGEYRFVYRIFFELYEAALFTAEGGNADDVLEAKTAFHLQFRYLREIDKSIILKSADRMLEKNLSAEERARISDRVARMNEAYTSVKDGDLVTFTYEPGRGTTLTINGKSAITIEGQDFTQLYFRIWLGEKALSSSLREHLLGRA
jgi:hypothetical protein